MIPTWSSQGHRLRMDRLPPWYADQARRKSASWSYLRGKNRARTGTVAILLRTRSQESKLEQHLPEGATRLHRDLSAWPNGPGLFYGTYHASKGLEFDTVLLPFLSDRNWPHRRDINVFGQTEAEIRDSRLLYVGITRARTDLILTYSGEPTALLPPNVNLYQS